MKDLLVDTNLSFFPLFLWFDHIMSLVSMLATLLANTFLIVAAKQVQGVVVLRAGSRVHCGELRVYVGLLWPSVWLDLQVDRHRWWNSKGVVLQAVGFQFLHSLHEHSALG